MIRTIPVNDIITLLVLYRLMVYPDVNQLEPVCSRALNEFAAEDSLPPNAYPKDAPLVNIEVQSCKTQCIDMEHL